MGVLVESPIKIKAKPLEGSLIESPGPAGAEFHGLIVRFIDETRADNDVFLDPLKIECHLKPGIRIPLKLDNVDPVVGLFSSLVICQGAGPPDVVKIAEIKTVVNRDVLVGVSVRAAAGIIKSNLGVFKNVLLHPKNGVEIVSVFRII